MDIGFNEIVILAVILLLLFGPKKIPKLVKGIGEAIRHLRGAFKDDITDKNQKNKLF